MIQILTKKIKHLWDMCIIVFFMVLAADSLFYKNAECTVLEDERLDQKVGLLAHPWRIFLPQSGTLDYLRQQAGKHEGLPFYAQQPEGAGYVPESALLETTYSSAGTHETTYPDKSDTISQLPEPEQTALPETEQSSGQPGYQFTLTESQQNPQLKITNSGDHPPFIFSIPRRERPR